MSEAAKEEHADRAKNIGHVLHYAHYAHRLHALSDGFEQVIKGLETTKHLAHVARGVADAQKTVWMHAQMARDLARVHVRIFNLESTVKAATKVAETSPLRPILARMGETAALRLIRARKAYDSMRLAFEAEQAQVAISRDVLTAATFARDCPHGAMAARLWPSALKLEPYAKRLAGALQSGRVRWLYSKTFSRALVVVAGAAAAVESYIESPAKTTAGKGANAVLGGAGGMLPMANPWTATADLMLPNGYTLSELYHGVADLAAAAGESIATNSTAADAFHRRSKEGAYGKVMQQASLFGDFFSDTGEAAIHALTKHDSRPLDDVHKRSMAGAYGKVLLAASEAGEFWAERGIPGGLKDFADSIRWWVSQ